MTGKGHAMRTLGALAISLLLAMLAPAIAQAEGVENPRRAIAIFEAATAAGDADAIADLYTDKATLLMPDGNALVGREAIRERYKRNFAMGPNSLTITDVKLDGVDRRAVMVWSWTLRIEPAGGAPISVSGRSMLYWHLIDDEWQISVEMYQQTISR